MEVGCSATLGPGGDRDADADTVHKQVGEDSEHQLLGKGLGWPKSFCV